MANVPLRQNPFDELQTRYILVAAVGCFVGIALAIVFLFQSWGLLEPQGPLFSPILMLLFYGCFGIWLLKYMQQKRILLLPLWGRSPHLWRWGMLLLLVALLLLFTLGTFLTYIGFLAWMAPPVSDGILNSTQEGILPDEFWLAQLIKLVVVVVAAPVVEEIAFRGILLQRWERKWGIHMALIGSSVAFGSLHLNPIGMTMFGLVMGLLYVRTRTLAVPVACHMINNAFALFLELFSSRGVSAADATGGQLGGGFGLGLVMLAISLPLLAMFIQRSWPRHEIAMPYVHNMQQYSAPASPQRLRARS